MARVRLPSETAAHLNAWLRKYRRPDEREEARALIYKAIKEHPRLLRDYTLGWDDYEQIGRTGKLSDEMKRARITWEDRAELKDLAMENPIGSWVFTLIGAATTLGFAYKAYDDYQQSQQAASDAAASRALAAKTPANAGDLGFSTSQQISQAAQGYDNAASSYQKAALGFGVAALAAGGLTVYHAMKRK